MGQEITTIEDDGKEISIDNLPVYPIYKVNHSRRVYNNGDFVDNGVAKEHLQDHVEYNKLMRFGTALFINGICVNRGYLGKKRCDELEKEIKALNIQVKQTIGLYR